MQPWPGFRLAESYCRSMSLDWQDLAKQAVVAFMVGGIGYLISGPLLGAIAFFLAAGVLVLVVKVTKAKSESQVNHAAGNKLGGQGISWIGSEGRLVRPKVRGYRNGIHIEDSTNVLVEDPDVQN